MSDTAPFFELLAQSLETGALVKATLSRPGKGAPHGLRNIFLRPVELRGAAMVSWTWRYERRDEVKNLTPLETLQRLRELCGPWFRNTGLFTATHEATLTHNRRGEPAIFIRQATATGTAAETRHDREKQRMLDSSSPWLRELGLTGPGGEVFPSSQAKWRQINKFLEIIAGLVRTASLPPDAHIADMGCGKGYLTFALYDYLTTHLHLAPHVTGVELRPELVEFCNAAARRAKFDSLRFEAGSIHGWRPSRLDMLIALHACDTATDEALATGIRAGASVIVVAPCCHKQVRKSMFPHNELSPLLQHGILAERQAELLTDGIRALLLESRGYRTSVFEFISTEHTAKNLMITAVKQGHSSAKALEQVAAIKESFGIRGQALEEMLE
ncbi:MAG TPA: SAM-dependent methyltransferase [Verrucomicrobiales bacterium]|nr:SAM-dependent methyltransferase [Verrucomicrobiales bacterium]